MSSWPGQVILKNMEFESNKTEDWEYDLSQLGEGVHGKYFERYQAGTNLALLAPEIRAAFPTDEAVNEALRSVMQSQ